MGRIWIALLCAAAAWAADAGADLRNAARRGRTAEVDAFAKRGVPVDSADKNGRTPLMMAAEKGHAGTVKLLLDRGAKADARDKDGWTAYGLAVMEGREDVVKLFREQPPIAAALEVKWAPDNVYNSCFMKPDQLADHLAGIQVDRMVAAAVSEYATLHGRGVAKIVESGGDVAVEVKVRPAISCLQQQTLDNVSMAIDVKVTRGSEVVVEKTIGGGLKGLKARTVSSQAQYAPLFAEWAKAHADRIYWAAVEGRLRAR